MFKKSRTVRYLYHIVTIVLVVIGFRYVAQAGQGLGVVQNDGYTVTGGFILLFSGLMIGIDVGMRLKEK